MNLKLKEIIWEITSKCDKGCKYCGSKKFLNSDKEDYEKTVQIAEMITKYPPESINISGGEPGCMDKDVLNKCIAILQAANIEVKIITNGEFFKFKDLRNKVDLVGYSVNTPYDIEAFGNTIELSENYCKEKVVIITNFGKHNIWDFDKIAEFAKGFAGWQVQLTTGHDLNLPKEGIQQLWNKLKNCNVSYVMADDLQPVHECTAGVQGCGITFDGYVMPCLSMRSWAVSDAQIWDHKDDYGLFNYNNDTEHCNPLKQIWETEFRHRRFCDDCPCCRDDFEYPQCEKVSVQTLEDYWKPFQPQIPDDSGTPNYPPGTVVVYGVTTNSTVTYQSNPSQNFRYGVTFPDKNIIK